MTVGSKTGKLTYSALGAVLIVICAWITVPFAVPFTLQTFAVALLLMLLGGRLGTTSILVYTLLGAVGIPVFSGFRGGIGHILGPTGGFILGFVVMGLIYILITALLGEKTIISIVAITIGMICCYLFGTIWYVYMSSTGTEYTFVSALAVCVFPFVLPDTIKITCALLLARTLKKYSLFKQQ